MATDILDEIMQANKGGCNVSHAGSIAASCGVTTQKLPGLPQYRCDRLPDHYGKHHVCGSMGDKQGWKIEWG